MEIWFSGTVCDSVLRFYCNLKFNVGIPWGDMTIISREKKVALGDLYLVLCIFALGTQINF